MMKGIRRKGESISGQVTGGTQERLLAVAVSRPWRISQSPAAPGLPGQGERILELGGCVNRNRLS